MPTELDQLLHLKSLYPQAKLVSGNTELGIEQRFGKSEFSVMISPTRVKEMNVLNCSGNNLTIGASTTLSDLYSYLKKLYSEEKLVNGKETPKQRSIRAITDQLHWFSGTSVRNTAGLGGNIMTASPISDLNPVWMSTGTTFTLQSKRGTRVVNASEFFVGYRKVAVESDEVLVSINYPFANENEYRESYKQSKRREDDIAIITSSFNIEFDKKGSIVIKKVALSFGGVSAVTKRATETEKFLQKCGEFNEKNFEEASKILSSELHIPDNTPGGKESYRTTLALSLFYKFYLSSLYQHGTPSLEDTPRTESARKNKLSLRENTLSTQYYNFPKDDPISTNALHLSGKKQVCGDAVYIDDIPHSKKELYGALVTRLFFIFTFSI